MLLAELTTYEKRFRTENARRQIPVPVPPSGYQLQPIKGIVELSAAGQMIAIHMQDGGTGRTDRGKLMAAPDLVRSSGIKAKLLADNAEYALGLARKSGDKQVALRHAAFLTQIEECLAVTSLHELETLLGFLRNVTASELTSYLWPEFDPAVNITFTVGGVLLINEPAVQKYWASVAQADAEGVRPVTISSAISGKVGPVIMKEPVKIKGIPGGQTSGMNFISANADAFSSYGLGNIGCAPVAFDEAEAYANALNRLLGDQKNRIRLGGIAYVFWTRSGETPPVSDALMNPPGTILIDLSADAVPSIQRKSRPEQVRDVIRGIWTGAGRQEIEAEEFFAAGLSASGARVAVRSYLKSTVKDVLSRLADFYLAQELMGRNPSDPPLYGLYALAGGLYMDLQKEGTPQDLTALLNFALSGTRLPHTFLQRLAGRNRAERRVTRPRAVLAKMTLISRGVIEMGTLDRLDLDHESSAYQLGRLLAVVEDVQTSVMRANATVVDRFYGSLSTTPRAVWGRLMQGAQPHLARLRKDNPGAYLAKQRMLEEVNSRISPDAIPNVLSLEEQALFSLGYYHQRAKISQDIQAAMAARENARASAEEGEAK